MFNWILHFVCITLAFGLKWEDWQSVLMVLLTSFQYQPYSMAGDLLVSFLRLLEWEVSLEVEDLPQAKRQVFLLGMDSAVYWNRGSGSRKFGLSTFWSVLPALSLCL